jgi:hypothetical protein
MEQPDGIIITISEKMLREKGYRNWLRNFLYAMGTDDCLYYMKQGAPPKRKILYVYLCIAGKIRYRANFVHASSAAYVTFSNGERMFARAWVALTGPVVKPKDVFPMKGFRGFRYTEKLF